MQVGAWYGANTAGLVTRHFEGYGLDETLLNWVLTVLIVGFMFCAGLVIVNFPWMFMGEITCEYCVEVSRFHESFYNIRTLVEVFSEYCENSIEYCAFCQRSGSAPS